MSRVLLLTMPFSFANRPSLGISLLRGGLQQRDIACDIRYLQLPFAAQVGEGLYYNIAQSAPRALLGEWLFAQHLFEGQLPDPKEYAEIILRPSENEFGDPIAPQLPQLRAMTDGYLEDCMATIHWEQYDVIGFSSSFATNLACLALAQRIKDAYPDKIIVLGGANCECEMGAELHRQFPFVDYVCSGESDRLFPELVERLAAGRSVEDLPGLVYRENGKTVASGDLAQPIFDLDSLPIPDFDDFFTQFENSGLALDPSKLYLTLETSRGCWWGAKSQCIFCGLNRDTMVYRSKSAERVLEEFTSLAQRYPEVKNVDAVDKILDMRYFKDVIPGLIKRDLGLNIFYFTKSNLNREQLRLLKRAGVTRIQPGIENLDSQVLKLMRKGCTSTQNVQLLKWGIELGLNVIWNFIAGFPGEDPEAYQRTAEIIPALVHLQPPVGSAAPVRLDRFSPYFQEPEAFGMVNVRPAAAYRFVYPFPEESLSRLAYYFDFDYNDGRKPEEYTQSLNQAVERWRRQNTPGSLLSLHDNGRVILYDTRPSAQQSEITLEGMAKAIYEFCDQGRTLPAILHHLEDLGEPYAFQAETTLILSTLELLVEARVMMYADERYLSLAIPIDEAAHGFIERFVAVVDGEAPPRE